MNRHSSIASINLSTPNVHLMGNRRGLFVWSTWNPDNLFRLGIGLIVIGTILWSLQDGPSSGA